MELISIDGKTNFFEKRVVRGFLFLFSFGLVPGFELTVHQKQNTMQGEYSKANVGQSAGVSTHFSTEEDF